MRPVVPWCVTSVVCLSHLCAASGPVRLLRPQGEWARRPTHAGRVSGKRTGKEDALPACNLRAAFMNLPFFSTIVGNLAGTTDYRDDAGHGPGERGCRNESRLNKR